MGILVFLVAFFFLVWFGLFFGYGYPIILALLLERLSILSLSPTLALVSVVYSSS